ncbi:MAG: phosphoglycerate kinase [Candidatus Vogelbacteria bacterium]|nr:phosphoglycerate kinase [Candidatus Vogelbacteria bacterium]
MAPDKNELPLISQAPAAALAGRTVLLRLDLNVPIENETVIDDFRIRKVMPTIDCLRAAGAKILLLSHRGQDGQLSLEPVAKHLDRFFAVGFCRTLETAARSLEPAAPAAVFLLENLRRDPGEAANDPEFVTRLARLGELYVNEAFASSHREHASIIGLPRCLPAYAGFNFAAELKNLSRAFTPRHPFTVILGGAKFETKLPVVRKFIDLADQIFIYGALAHAFFKELGYELGQSLVDRETVLARPFLNHPKIVLPVDVRVKNGDRVFIKTPDQLTATDNILDVGLLSLEKLLPAIGGARFILWNGPLGNFERGFHGATEAAAKLIAGSNATTIVGGGDTIAAIRSLDLLNQLDFVSTAGGAMLDFLAYGTLPGIEALKHRWL